MHNFATSDLNAVIGRQAFAASWGHACCGDGKHGNPKRVPIFFLYSASKIKVNAIPSMPARVAVSTSSRHRDRDRERREREKGEVGVPMRSFHVISFDSFRLGMKVTRAVRSAARGCATLPLSFLHLPLPENSQWRHVGASQSRSLCFANFRRPSVHEKPSSVREFARQRLFLVEDGGLNLLRFLLICQAMHGAKAIIESVVVLSFQGWIGPPSTTPCQRAHAGIDWQHFNAMADFIIHQIQQLQLPLPLAVLPAPYRGAAGAAVPYRGGAGAATSSQTFLCC